jgi:transposase
MSRSHDDIINDLRARLAAKDQLIEELRAFRASAERMNEAQQAQNRQLTRLVEGLHDQIRELLLKQARASKPDKDDSKSDGSSDSGDSDSSDTQDGPTDVAGTGSDKPSDIKPPPRKKKTKTKPKGKPRRRPLPDHLERQETVIDVETCSNDDCQSTNLTGIGRETSEKLVFRRACVYVRQTTRLTKVCNDCETISTAPLPPTAVPRGQMTSSFLAHIAYCKCALHLPLARIAEDALYLGVRLASSTLCGVMVQIALLLTPIYDRIVAALFESRLMHADGTGLKVLEPGQKGTHRGQFVVYCNDRLTVYGFAPSKHGKHITKFLRIGKRDQFVGKLVADAASNMNGIYTNGLITECGCWQHLRGKFKVARASAPIKAEEGIAWIGTVFDVEKTSKELGETAEERLARRRTESRPLVKGFERWMVETQHQFEPDEELYKAIQYFRNHRTALLRALEDGAVDLTNNLAERELGVIGRGRKAYLFAGSDDAARALAKIYTVVRTCQRLAVDPYSYLTDVLPRLSDLPVNRGRGHLKTLTPWGWQEAQAASAK